MSWLRKAFNICSPNSRAYYTTLDPLVFYEWIYTKTAPKGHVFSAKLPSSDIVATGKAVVAAIVPETNLKKSPDGYVLTQDSPVEVSLKIGYMPSPRDLLNKYDSMIKTQQHGLEAFKADLQTRVYLNSTSSDPNLFRFSKCTDNEVTMHNFGSVEKLREQFSLVRSALIGESLKKKGRAHELEDFRRYENAMTFINNSHLHVDSAKMDRLIETSGVRALQTRTLPWIECYLDMSPGARQLHDRIKFFEDQTWVSAAIKRSR